MSVYASIHSAVSHPDVFWHFLNGMGAQKDGPEKSFSNIFLMHILYKN